MGNEVIQKLFRVCKLKGSKYSIEYAEKIRMSFARRATVEQCMLFFDNKRLSRFALFWINNRHREVLEMYNFLLKTSSLLNEFENTNDMCVKKNIAIEYNKLTRDFGIEECN